MVIEVSEEEALRMIEAGHAESVDRPSQSTDSGAAENAMLGQSQPRKKAKWEKKRGYPPGSHHPSGS